MRLATKVYIRNKRRRPSKCTCGTQRSRIAVYALRGSKKTKKRGEKKLKDGDKARSSSTANVSGSRAGYLSRASLFVARPAGARSISRTTNVAPAAACISLGTSKNKTAASRILPFAVARPLVLCSWKFRIDGYTQTSLDILRSVACLLTKYNPSATFLLFFYCIFCLNYRFSVLLSIGTVHKFIVVKFQNKLNKIYFSY